METNYQTKLIINILFVVSIFLLVIIFIFRIKIVCLSKILFNVPCPACGLTEAFKYIMNFKLIDATKSNILSVPIFVSLILFYFIYIFSLITKKKCIIEFYKYYAKQYKIIIILLIVSFIYNFVK